MTQKEKENFYRNSTLIVDHTNESFTGLLDHDLTKKGLTLFQFIQAKQHEIYHLCYNNKPCCMCPTGCTLGFKNNNRILNHAQLDILLDTSTVAKLPGHNQNNRTTKHCCCPANPNINYEKLDLTLTRCLLVNFTTVIPAGSQERLAVDELINLRNVSYGHATNGFISDQVYQDNRTKIEQHIMVLAKVQGKEPEFKQKLKDAAVRPLDGTILKLYQSKLLEDCIMMQKYKNNDIPEFLTKDLEDLKIVEGCDARLELWTTDYDVNVEWLKDGNIIEMTDRHILEVSRQKHSLVVTNTELADRGIYIAQILNSVRSAKLDVEEYFTRNMKHYYENIEGHNVELSCAVLEDNVTANWVKDGVSVKQSDKYKILDEGKTHKLCITHTNLHDAGKYWVNVNDRKRSTYVLVKDYFTKNLQRVECIEGETVEFTCEVIEDSVPACWSKNGNHVKHDGKYEIVQNGRIHRLSITYCDLIDAGDYTVTINNRVRTASLCVKDYFTKNLQRVECIEGETVEFTCEVIEDSFPACWSKNGNHVKHDGKYEIVQNGRIHRLSITYCDLIDAGDYTVTINNRVRTASLCVKEYFTQNMERNIECREGDDVELSCAVIEESAPAEWKKEGFIVQQSGKFITVALGVTHKLSIISADLHDAGSYTVIVNNRARSTSLKVKEYFTHSMERIVECEEGDNLELSCAVIEDNVPAVWTKDGIAVQQSAKKHMKDVGKMHKLIIKQADRQDAGKYTVMINNRKRSTTLQVKEIPAAIRQLSEKDKRLYLDIIMAGTETRYYIRIVIIGENGVGKTCLLRRLLGETIDDVESTDGVDIVHRCKIRLSDGHWVIDGDRKKAILSRIRKAVYSEKSQDVHSQNIMHSRIDQPEISEDILHSEIDQPKISEDILHSQINQPKISEDILYSRIDQPEISDDILYSRIDQPEISDDILYSRIDQPEISEDILHSQLDQREISGNSSIQKDSYYAMGKSSNETSIPKKMYNQSGTIIADENSLKQLKKHKDSIHSNNIKEAYIEIAIEDIIPNTDSDSQEKIKALSLHVDDVSLSEDTLRQSNPLKIDGNQIETNREKVLTEQVLNELSELLDDIEKSDIPDEVLVECGFWDFAGQRHYYPTHPVFLNPNAVHLLVANIMKDIKKINAEDGFDKIGEYVDFWFDSVHSCKDMENTTDNSGDRLHPPVIVVCTGIDNCKSKLEERKKEFRTQLKNLLEHEIKEKHLRRICWVSNTEPSDKDFNYLRKSILKFGQEMKTFGEKLPFRWIRLERLLDIVREADVNILSWSDMTDLSSICSIYNEEEIILFLKYHHKVGSIIYFESLKENIILNQKWLADAFRCLVSDKFESDITLTPEWKMLEDTGKLDPFLIDKLFQKDPQLKFHKHQKHLLNVMELFGIIVKLRTLLEDGEQQLLSTYYIPCMISKQTSIVEINKVFCVEKENCKRTPWLCMEFKFMPLDFFNHILCYYISQYQICSEPYTEPLSSTQRLALYNGMGVFYFDKSKLRKFILCFSKNTTSIQLWLWKEIEQATYKVIIEELKSVILRVKGKFEPRDVSYTIKLKCSDGNIHNPDGRLSYKELMELGDEYMCEDHIKVHNTQDFLQTWFADYSENEDDSLASETVKDSGALTVSNISLAIANNDVDHLVNVLQNPASDLPQVYDAARTRYMEELRKKKERNQDDLDYDESIMSVLYPAVKVLSAVARINQALNIEDSENLYKTLAHEDACIPNLKENNADKYQELLAKEKSAKGGKPCKLLTHCEICLCIDKINQQVTDEAEVKPINNLIFAAVKVLSTVASINQAMDIGDSEKTYEKLANADAHFPYLNESNADRYQNLLVKAKAAKQKKPCKLLTHNEICWCIEEVNQQVTDENIRTLRREENNLVFHELHALESINQALDIGDSKLTFSRLADTYAYIPNLIETNADIYQRFLAEGKEYKKKTQKPDIFMSVADRYGLTHTQICFCIDEANQQVNLQHQSTQDTRFKQHCQVCDKKPSVCWCHDCKRYMCKICNNGHDKSDDTCKHIVRHEHDTYSLDYSFKVNVDLIRDIKVLHDDVLVLTDFDGKQLITCHISGHQQHTIPIPGHPNSIAVVDNNTIAVTIMTEKPHTLELMLGFYYCNSVLIEDLQQRQVIRLIDVKVECSCIMYRDNQLFVGCKDKTIRIMKMSGDIIYTIPLIHEPMNICGGKEGHIYYVSGPYLHCIDKNGKHLFTFRQPTENIIVGLATDDAGYLLAICNISEKVLRISPDCKQSQVIFSQKAEGDMPFICYHSMSKLVVIVRSHNSVYVYKNV